MPRHPDEILEDKVAIGGSGLVAARKPKAGISMEKAYGFPVWTWVRIPPAPQRDNYLIIRWLSLFYFLYHYNFVPILSQTPL